VEEGPAQSDGAGRRDLRQADPGTAQAAGRRFLDVGRRIPNDAATRADSWTRQGARPGSPSRTRQGGGVAGGEQ
jgi:hypothetical protein